MLKKIKVILLALLFSLSAMPITQIEAISEKEKIKQIPTTEASVRGFTVRMYRLVLEREADVSGYQYWENNLKGGKVSGAEMGYGFFFSNEMKQKNLPHSAYLRLLYKAMMNREADTKGLEFWRKKLSLGISREEVYQGFAESNEFKSICQKYGIRIGVVPKRVEQSDYMTRVFVGRLYEKSLHREGDIKGINEWTTRIKNNQISGAKLVAQFVNSKEFQNKVTTDESYIQALYEAVLDRGAAETEVQYWLKRMEDGFPKDHVLRSFVSSKEFDTLCKKYGVETGSIEVADELDHIQKPVEVVEYHQDDPKWGNKWYWPRTFAAIGCAPTVIAMAASSLLGKEITPHMVADYLVAYPDEFHGSFGTNMNGFYRAAKHFGLKVVPLRTKEQVTKALKNGYMLAVSVGPNAPVLFPNWNPNLAHAELLYGLKVDLTRVYNPLSKGTKGWYSVDTYWRERTMWDAATYQGNYALALGRP